MAITKTMERDDGWMPNRGFAPSTELVTIKFRNGIVVRCIDPRKYRWKQWPEGPHDFDIASWRVSESKDYELVFADARKG